MLPPVIFFDLDDTIVSFEGIAAPLWQELSEQYCRRTGQLQAETVLTMIRRTGKWYWSDPERHRAGRLNIVEARRNIVKQAFQELGIMNVTEACALADEFSVERLERMMVFPGAQETLTELRERGVRLALLTNGDSAGQHAKIDRFGLRGYFEQIFVEEDMGFGKPDERVYRLALETMRVNPQDVWMVGDNLDNDVGAPQALGILGIWNDYRQQGLPESSLIIPDQIINSITEVVESMAVRDQCHFSVL
jgi:putative hydrolase of the HAD superfamily